MQIKTTLRFHLMLIRMAIIKKSGDNGCWRGCGAKETLLHSWECKLIQPLWKTVWRLIKDLEQAIPFDTLLDSDQLYPFPCKWHELILFYGSIVFHGIYVPHFLYPVCHWWAFGLVPSLCYCEQCHNKHMCACVFIIIYNSLGIYPVMGLLDQMVFLVLDHWGIATLSSTMVELIFTPTNSVKAFLFLHILSSISCLQIF